MIHFSNEGELKYYETTKTHIPYTDATINGIPKHVLSYLCVRNVWG